MKPAPDIHKPPQQRSFENGELSPENYPLLPISEAAWNWFLEACADLEITVSPEQKLAIQKIYSHLVGVNEFLNLTRITNDADYLNFHFFDSLTALSLVQAYTESNDLVLDLGSGGGYPGLPLALFLPDRRWVLVDSRAKKVAFLKEAMKLTGTPSISARAFRGREAPSVAKDLARKCKMLLCRAVGRADDLLPDAAALLQANGIFLLLKGQSYPTTEREDFLRAMPRFGFTLMEEHPIALDNADPDRWIVLALKTD